MPLNSHSKSELVQGVAVVNICKNCRDGELRLGNNTGEGIAEICRNGQFSPLCGNNWTKENSNVVCRQAGYFLTQSKIQFNNRTYG